MAAAGGWGGAKRVANSPPPISIPAASLANRRAGGQAATNPPPPPALRPAHLGSTRAHLAAPQRGPLFGRSVGQAKPRPPRPSRHWTVGMGPAPGDRVANESAPRRVRRGPRSL